ncbi:MAG: ABC transporter ATP-binding protein [Myxococcales bacterium]|nr:ABC transporter ATP-binding protein/permease [Polyangiaceae bacterium]MDW8248893.1 ABC transporter ATP-binding protein [Myxococcales bacterium]
MTSTLSESHPPTRGASSLPLTPAPTPSPTLQVLAFAARLWGVPYNEEAIERVLEDLPVSLQPEARELEAQLRQAAPVIGFEVVPFAGPASEVMNRAHPGAPAFRIVAGASGQPRWVALLGQRLGRAVLSEIHAGLEPKELSAEETSRLLKDAGDSPWFFLEPQRPLEAAKGGHHDHPPPWNRFWALMRPESSDLGVVVVYAVLVGLLSLAVPVAVQALVNTVAFGVLRQPVLVLTVLVLTGLVFAGVFRAAQVHVVEVLQRRIFVRAAVDTASRLAQSQVSAFDGRSGPELVNRFFDVLTLQKSAATLLLDGLGIVLQIAIGALLMAFYHPMLLAFDVVLMAVLAFNVLVLGRGGVATSLAESQAKYEVVAWLEELAGHNAAFHSAGGRAFASMRVQHLCSEYLRARRSHFRIVMRQTVAMLALHAIASAALLGVGAILVMERQLTLGQLVAAELIVSAMLAGISKLGKYLETFYDLLTAADKLGYLIDLPLERVSGQEPKGSGPMEFECRNLSFAYEPPHDPHHGEPHRGHHAHPIFQSISLRGTRGESIGIYGAQSSGKSTLAELLLGYRSPSEGLIFFDGVDQRELRLDGLRSQVALVRGIELFDGTIAENVRAGRTHLGPEDIRRAVEFVGLLPIIQSFPEGLRQRILPQGGPLSDGQALLLSLARAVAGSPRMLVIDGTLDGLSLNQQETLLQRLMDPAMPWTLLLLTRHRHLADRCHRSFLLSHGHLEPLEDSGPHSIPGQVF